MKLSARMRAFMAYALLILPDVLLLALIPILWVFIFRLWLSCLLFVAALVAYAVFIRPGYRLMLFDRLVLSAYRDGNLAQYRKTLHYLHMDHAGNDYWISACYDAGEYQFVIDACTWRIRNAHHKAAKYKYLPFLAGVYMHMGDNQKLSAVCDTYDAWIAAERNPKKYTQLAKVFARYRAYLCKDEQALMQLTACSGTSVGLHAQDLILQARFAWDVKQDAEGARALFEQILATAKAQALHEHAQYALDCIARGTPYAASLPELVPDPYFRPKRVRRIAPSILAHVLPLLLVGILAIGSVFPLREWNQQRILIRDISSAVKRIDVRAEPLSVLLVYDQDGYFVTELCIYELNGMVVIGETFIYEDYPDYIYVEPVTELSVEHIKDTSRPLHYLVMSSVLYRIFMTGHVWRDKSEIPADAYCYQKFKLDGQTYYFGITEITLY